MKKLNRNYISFYEWLAWMKPSSASSVLSEKPIGYSEQGPRYHDNSPILGDNLLAGGYQLLGSLHPFYRIAKDISNTIRPYAHEDKITFDLLQPVIGIKNVLVGTGSLLGGALVLAASVLISPLMLLGCAFPFSLEVCQSFFTRHLLRPLAWMIEGAAKVLRGVTQIITSPLNYLLRIPLRRRLTKKMESLQKTFLAEEKPTIQNLALQAYSLLDQIKTSQSTSNKVTAILFEVQRKYKHSIREGWDTKKFTEETNQFKTIYPFFKRYVQENFNEEQKIDENIIQLQKYFENFIPAGFKKQNQEKKFYVVGKPIKMKKIEHDLVHSLRYVDEVYIFNHFTAAKNYADIYSDVHANGYPPVIEVVLIDQNNINERELREKGQDYANEEVKRKYVEKFLVDKKNWQCIMVNNIQYISGYSDGKAGELRRMEKYIEVETAPYAVPRI